MKTKEELKKELNELLDKMKTSISFGEYDQRIGDWRKRVKEILKEIKELESHE